MHPLDTLKSKIKNLDSGSLFGDNFVEKEVETACVLFLKSLGYKVVNKPRQRSVKNIDELINYFYSLLEYHHNEVCSLVSNKQKDRALLARFISLRQAELQYSFDECLQDCVNIITALFVFEKDLGLTIPIGMWVFGGDKCKWVTDKVISMLNNNEEALNEVRVENMIIADELRDCNSYTGFDFEHLRRVYGK